MQIAALGGWVPHPTPTQQHLKSKEAYAHYLVEGSAEELCLVLAVN